MHSGNLAASILASHIANRLLRIVDSRCEAQLRQSYWEVSRKPLILRGETDGIPGDFPEM